MEGFGPCQWVCGPDQRCWRDHVLNFHKRRDVVSQPRDPANSFYLLAGPLWTPGDHTESCLQYREQVAIRQIHAGKTPAAKMHAKEVAFQKVVQKMKEDHSARDSFAVAAGVSVAAPVEVADKEGSEEELDDEGDSDGGDVTGVAVVQITADRVLSPQETAGSSSGAVDAGDVPKITPPKRPSSSLETPSDTEMEDFVNEHRALSAGGRKKVSTPKSKHWLDESESSPSVTSGDDAEEEDEAGDKVSREGGSTEGSGMEVDDEETAIEGVVASSSLGDTDEPRGNVLATEGDDQGKEMANNNEVGAVGNEYAMLPGQQNHMATGI